MEPNLSNYEKEQILKESIVSNKLEVSKHAAILEEIGIYLEGKVERKTNKWEMNIKEDETPEKYKDKYDEKKPENRSSNELDKK